MFGFIFELLADLLFFDFLARVFRKDQPTAPGEDDPDPFAANRPELPPTQDPPRII